MYCTQLLELLWVQQAALFTRRALRLPPASSTQERDYAAPRGPSAECLCFPYINEAWNEKVFV